MANSIISCVCNTFTTFPWGGIGIILFLLNCLQIIQEAVAVQNTLIGLTLLYHVQICVEFIKYMHNTA